MNVAVLKYGCGKSRAVEVIRMKYRSGSGLPGIGNSGEDPGRSWSQRRGPRIMENLNRV